MPDLLACRVGGGAGCTPGWGPRVASPPSQVCATRPLGSSACAAPACAVALPALPRCCRACWAPPRCHSPSHPLPPSPPPPPSPLALPTLQVWGEKWAGKTLRIRNPDSGKTMEVTIYDTCDDAE